MPRYALYDASNNEYRLDTFDTSQLRPWLREWTRIIHGPKPLPAGQPPLRMAIRPLFRWDWKRGRSGEPDWNADIRFFYPFEVPWDTEGIMAAIEAERARIQHAKAARLV